MTHPSYSRWRGVLGITLGLLLSVGCGQQGTDPGHEAEGSQQAAISRTRPRVKLAASRTHSLAIRSDGTVWAAGQNDAGQLGQVGPVSSSTPLQAPGLTGAIAVAAGDWHAVVLRSGGTVWAWGDGSHGQLGTPEFPDGPDWRRATPAQVPGLSGVVAVAAGFWHTLAVKSDGTVWSWGSNNEGELGDGGLVNRRYSPGQVPGLTNVVAVSARRFTSFAIRSDGTLWGWGSNDYGMLGIGNHSSNSKVPVQVPGLTNVVAVSAGEEHTLAVKSDGTVWTWGLQDRATLTMYLSPVQVPGLTGVIDVATSTHASYALKSNGTVWSWGDNTSGQIGDGTRQRRDSPIQVKGLTGVSVIAGGDNHALVLRSDGTIWTWGGNRYGARGDGAITLMATPGLVQVNATGALAVAAGTAHSLALLSDGTVWSWGANTSGQLGDGTTERRSTPAPVVGLQNVIAIAAGAETSMALRDDNTVWTWGNQRLVPTRVSGVDNVIAISTSGTHSLALRDDSTVWAWGSNARGELGDGTLVSRTTPAQVSQLVDVMRISTGPQTSYAVRYDGSAWGWGENGYGQLGGGGTSVWSTPGLIPGLNNVLAIAGGSRHGMAVLADGSGRSWGLMGFDDGTSSTGYAPHPMASLQGLLEVVSGRNTAAATTATGAVWVESDNSWGQAGNGTTYSASTPVLVSGITGGVTSLAVGDEHMLAVQPDGTVWSWGSNTDGQLGRGQPFDILAPVPSLLD